MNAAYITTSIPYVNGSPHVGHALEFVQADAFARYRRQVGQQVRLQTGSDDNSLKNVLAAAREGLPVRDLVQRNAALFRQLADRLSMSYDGFLRTSADPAHGQGVDALWRRCAAAGDIYRRHYRGLYCVGCEQFYTDAELTADGLCPEHGTRPDVVEEENYFFRLSRFGPVLHEMIARGDLRIVPETRRNEVLTFIAGGLQDFSISRSQARARGWGVAVPDDPSQVMYVWFDALGNYITALDFGAGSAADPPELYRTYWLESAARVHVIGKGILRFHAVYWPAMLISAGLPLPTTVFVHGYVTVEGQKIGKSLGNAVDPGEIVDRYGASALRWYLLREVPTTTDSDFALARLVARYNTDLANDLGNLLNRTVSMLHRYRAGRVPGAGQAPATVSELPGMAAVLPATIARAMDAGDPRQAAEAIWGLVSRANKLVDETAPWVLWRAEQGGDREAATALDAVLYTLLETLRLVAIHLEPFIPEPAAHILEAIGAADDALPYAERVRWGLLRPGTATAPPTPLFPRLDPPDTAHHGRIGA